MAAPVDATASLQQVLAQLEALRLENQRLQSLVAGREVAAPPIVGHGVAIDGATGQARPYAPTPASPAMASATTRSQQVGSPLGASGAAAGPAVGPPPKRSYGEMKLWVGSWNMGAKDPFADLDAVKDMDTLRKVLAPFIPLGYDVYVLGVQEGISDKVFEVVEAYTGAFRLPLNAKLFPAREFREETKIRSRRMGRAVTVQSFLEDAEAGVRAEPVVSTADMLDRVWGRGDGALLTPKFTGIGVFVAKVVAPYTRLLGVYKHSFGASEGSKGGVGVALGMYDVTVAFINAHMASKRMDLRRAQYCELVDRLGAKLGGRGFGINEEFHHIIWMGDLNFHCAGVKSPEALKLLREGRQQELLLEYDEMLREKEAELCFYEYEEPLMGPRFFPTYKKVPERSQKVKADGSPLINYRDPDWVTQVYCTQYKEPFYKGGRVKERIPSWTDRIQYHSLPDRSGELLPEPYDPDHPDTSPHNYHAVNEGPGLDVSDHSPIFCTFSLQICAEEVDDAVAEAVENLQAQMGYRPEDEELGLEGGAAAAAAAAQNAALVSFRPHAPVAGILSDADFSAIHPLLRPLVVVLHVGHIMVDYKGQMRSPRAVSVLFPLPYEDSNEIPERAKIVRAGTLMTMSARSETVSTVSATIKTIVSRQSKLESLHLLLKVSLDDNTKAQCVVCMRDGGFVGAGSHMNTFLQPLTMNGVPFKVDGHPISAQFVLEMNAYERGGTQNTGGMRSAAPSMTSPQPFGGAGGSGGSVAGTPGMSAARKAYTAVAAAAPVAAAPAPVMAPTPMAAAPVPPQVAAAVQARLASPAAFAAGVPASMTASRPGSVVGTGSVMAPGAYAAGGVPQRVGLAPAPGPRLSVPASQPGPALQAPTSMSAALAAAASAAEQRVALAKARLAGAAPAGAVPASPFAAGIPAVGVPAVNVSTRGGYVGSPAAGGASVRYL